MNLLQIESNTDIELYFDELTDTNFTPLITSPTRVTSKTKTLIDNIFFNEFCSNIVSGNLSVGISDHMPQFALIPTKTSNISNQRISEKRYGRKYKNINLDNMNKDLYNINWNINGMEDANQYGDNFLNVFDQILDVHAPMTEIKQSKNTTDKMPNHGLQIIFLN